MKTSLVKANELTELLQSIEWVNIDALNRVCGLPERTIYRAVSGSRALPEKHVAAIVNELRKLKT